VLRHSRRGTILWMRLPLTHDGATRPEGASGRLATRPYYGWVLVGALGITETISWGVLYYAFSVFLQPMEADLGWSRGATTGAFSLALVLSGFAAIPVGRWLDRHGARLLMSVGSCLGTLLVLAWAWSTSLLVFYLVWAAIGLVMATVLYEPAFAVVAVWFDRKRAPALTALTLIAGFSSTVFLPLAAWLIQIQGWRPALVSLAALLALGTIPAHALLLRRRPEDIGLHPDGEPQPPQVTTATPRRDVPLAEALRDPTFRWLVLAFCLSTAVAFGVHVHLVPILLDRGYSPTLAAALAGLVGAMQVLGRVLMSPLTGRVSLRTLSAGVLAVQPAALLVLLLVPGFMVLFGAAKGCLTLVRPAFVADLYGRANYASIAGVLAFVVTLAQAGAPVGAGAAYDALGGYGPILWALVAVSAVASICLLPARRESSLGSSGKGAVAAAAASTASQHPGDDPSLQAAALPHDSW
jgi:MFS family permease